MEIRRFYAEDKKQGLEEARLAMGADMFVLDMFESNGRFEIVASTGPDQPWVNGGTQDSSSESSALSADEEISTEKTVCAAEETCVAGEAATDTQVRPLDEEVAASEIRDLQTSLAKELEYLTEYRKAIGEIESGVDLLPEDLQGELFILRKSLRRELEQLEQYRKDREQEDALPNPKTERLHDQLNALQKSLKHEMSELSDYREKRALVDEESDPITNALQSELSDLQSALKIELSQLADNRAERKSFDAETEPLTRELHKNLDQFQRSLNDELEIMHDHRTQLQEFHAESDPATKELLQSLRELRSTFASEIEYMGEYRQYREQFDAASDPVTKSLQNGLVQLQENVVDLQMSLTDELAQLTEYRDRRETLDAESDPRTIHLQSRLGELQENLENELNSFNEYRSEQEASDRLKDSATTELQTELTKMHRSLRSELVQLGRQRDARDQINIDDNAARLKIQQENSELQQSLQQQLSSLSTFTEQQRDSRREIDAKEKAARSKIQQENSELQQSLQQQLSNLSTFTEQQRYSRQENDAQEKAARLHMRREHQELQQSLEQQVAELRAYGEKMQAENGELQASLREELSLLHDLRMQQEVRSSDPAPAVEEVEKKLPTSLLSLTKILSDTREKEDNESDFLSNEESKTLNPLKDTEKKISALGLSADVMRSFNKRIPKTITEVPDWRPLLQVLGSLLHIANDEIISNGGIVYLVGSAGVGKTTSAAKLAGQYSLRHGPGKVALISTDTVPVGGAELLINFAEEHNIPLARATDADSLTQKIQEFQDYELVLIDTVGTNQRGIRLAEDMQASSDINEGIAYYLVVSATSELVQSEEVITSLRRVPLQGAIVTKIDEASTFGPFLSSIIRHNLKLSYVCDGPKAPDDIAFANRAGLMTSFRNLICQTGHQLIDTQAGDTQVSNRA